MANKKIKILAIDDNSDNLIVLKALVNDLFPDVLYFSAGSGNSGIDLCLSEKPDVVLLDIVMPGMDGYEVCKRIKADMRLKHIPVVMVTANRADKASRVKALEAGADAFLPKPVDESELKAQIKAMLRIKEAEDLKRAEKQHLEDLVLDRTEALEIELADRIKAENKLLQSLEKITRNKFAIMNLMEDLKGEMAERKIIEESLQVEKNLLRTLIDNLPDTIYILDKEGKKVIANKADVQHIGAKNEVNVIGKNDIDLFPGEFGIRGHADNLSVIETGIPIIDREEFYYNRNGEPKWLLTSKYPLYDANGKIKGLFGTGHDITQRKVSEEKISQKNTELSFLNKLATDLASLRLEENLPAFINIGLKEFTGSEFLVYSEFDPVHNNLITKHIESDKKVLNKLIKIIGDKILDKPAPINISDAVLQEMLTEIVVEKKSLTDISFGAIPSIIDKSFGTFSGIDRYLGITYVVSGELFGTSMIGIKKGRNIPSFELLKSFAHIVAVSLQRNRAEKTLQLSEEKFRNLIQNQGEGVGIVDLTEKFVFVNPAAEEMFGVKPGELLNRNLIDFIPEDKKKIVKSEFKHRVKEEKASYEIEIVRPNSEIRTVLITATPQFNQAGKLTGTFGVFRDITQRKLNELELTRKQEFIETILENSPLGFAVNKIDDGSIIYVGSKFEEIYGVERGSIKSVSEFFDVVYTDPVLREEIRERTIKDIMSKDPSRMRWNDIEFTTRSGETKFVTAINIPLYDQNLTISTVQDVTLRNISQKALKESYEFNNSLLSTIPFGMDIVDEEGNILFQSEKLNQLFGNMAIGSKCWELYRDDKKQCSDCPLFGGIKIGVTEDYESSGVLGGKVFNISHTGILFHGKKAMLEIFIDITERKSMEQKITESEAYYRTLVDISPDGIIISDLEGRVSYGSIKALEIFGIPEGENVIGTSILKWLATDNQSAIMDRVADILSGNTAPQTREYKLLKYNGEEFWGELSSSPIIGKDGISTALIIVCRDISDRKRAENELIKAKEKAEENDKLKTAFIHNISHEIRTPMNAIIGFASLLNESDQDKNSQAEYVDVITQSCYNLLGIVTDIIEISNIEAGILSLNLKSTSLRTIIKAINSQFNIKISEKGLVFKINPEILTKEIILNTDEAKLEDILKNLLNNALKFTSRGVIELDYAIKGDFIEFRVSDTGIGISPDQQKKIFERFYQVESEINRQYEGAGLGLSISKGYVDPLGGEIWIESEPGKGSSFYFTIPLKNVSSPEKDITQSAKPVKKILPGKMMTLLVAEDEEYNFKYIEAVLSPLNFRLIHAENGQEAVDICKSDNSINLVVMDIKMPVMDGYQATSIIKKIRPSLPIIAQTAYAFEADKENAFKAGCDDYIAKPVKKQVLIDTIMKYLRN